MQYHKDKWAELAESFVGPIAREMPEILWPKPENAGWETFRPVIGVDRQRGGRKVLAQPTSARPQVYLSRVRARRFLFSGNVRSARRRPPWLRPRSRALLAWGNFLTVAINFVIVAWVLFLIDKARLQ